MSIPEELRARIVELDIALNLQRELPRKLERDKSLVQRRLNAFLDPVAGLPLEISSEISVQSLAPFPKPGTLHTPMLFLNVCHAWSDIALATPTLWAGVHIVFPCARGFKEGLTVWLECARNRPLSVLLEGVFDHDIVSIIWGHGQELQHLEICDVRAKTRSRTFGARESRAAVAGALNTHNSWPGR
jgi:hypothetical protein